MLYDPEPSGDSVSLVDRRRLLLISGAITSLTFARPSVAHVPAPGVGDEWTRRIAETRTAALRGVVEDGWSPSTYVRFLSSEATRLGPAPDVDLQAVPWMDPAMWFGMLSAGRPFAVTRWKMAPGAIQPVHDHPNASVCTLVLSGELRMENFEPVEASSPADSDPFALRRTRVERLTAGRTSVLAPEENNLHRLNAGPAGAEGIDLNTMHGAGARFSHYRLTPTRDSDLFTGRRYVPEGAGR